MNRWMRLLLPIGVPALLLLAGCQSKAQAFVPVTGGDKSSLPEPVALTRANVLEYILASARLANIPPVQEWQLDARQESENEYRFRSGDWLMLISFTETADGNQRVIILNKADHAAWTGYVTPNGRVVDTTYGR
jgi:hypothetical protein